MVLEGAEDGLTFPSSAVFAMTFTSISECNRSFGGVFYVCFLLYVFEISLGIGAVVIGLSQISSFCSLQF